MHGNEASVLQLCIKFYNCVWGKGRLGLGVGGSHAVSICLAWHMYIRDKLAKAFKTTFLMLKNCLPHITCACITLHKRRPHCQHAKSIPVPPFEKSGYGSVSETYWPSNIMLKTTNMCCTLSP